VAGTGDSRLVDHGDTPGSGAESEAARGTPSPVTGHVISVVSPALEWLTGVLVDYRWVWLLVAVTSACAGWLWTPALRFDQSLEALYSHDNPRLRDFNESKRVFGGDELAIVAWRQAGLMEPAGMEHTGEFGAKLGKIPGIRAESQQNLRDTLGMMEHTLRNFERVPGLRRRIGAIREAVLEMFRGLLLGDDRETTAVIVRFSSREEATVPRAQTVRELRAVADAHAPPAHVVGEPVQVHDMFQYVEEDSRLLGWVSFGLLMIVIFALFRGVRWMVLPIVVVQVTLVWSQSIFVYSGMSLSMVSSTLSSLVMVVGAATVIHVMFVFRELRSELEPVAAMRETLRRLLVPIFWTCATTAAGFAIQITSHIHPARSFGLMMGIATMVVLVAVVMVLPGGILLGQANRSRPRVFGQAGWLTRPLELLSTAVQQRPGAFVLAFAVLSVLSLVGCRYLRVETEFSRNFRPGSPIVRALTFVEDRLGGAGTWEINFAAPAELDNDYLTRVRSLTAQLRAIETRVPPDPDLQTSTSPLGLSKVLSPTDGIDLLPPILGLGWQMRVLNTFQPEFLPSLYNPEEGRMRILLRAYERQTSEAKLRVIAEVERLANETLGDVDPERPPRATGLFVLLTFLIESLLGDQWTSSIISTVVLVLMMAVAFRSLYLGWISLAPNLLPIVFVLGTMGWLGLPVNIATAMIASVSMGLTIDSTIHFLAGLRFHESRGLSFPDALRASILSVGSALIFANLALILGFLALCVSNFIPLVYFGALVGVAMFGGLVGNLMLLPALLQLTRRPVGVVR
jgi:uncharacterized protein